MASSVRTKRTKGSRWATRNGSGPQTRLRDRGRWKGCENASEKMVSKAWKGEAKSAMCVLSMSVVVVREVVVVVGGRGWTSTAVAVAVGVTLLCAERSDASRPPSALLCKIPQPFLAIGPQIAFVDLRTQAATEKQSPTFVQRRIANALSAVIDCDRSSFFARFARGKGGGARSLAKGVGGTRRDRWGASLASRLCSRPHHTRRSR